MSTGSLKPRAPTGESAEQGYMAPGDILLPAR